MSVDNASTIGSLKRRLISTELAERSHNLNDDNANHKDIDVDAVTSFDSSASDEQINRQLGGSQEQDATTPIRKNRFPNRKNLSQSFLYGDDTCGDEIMEMQTTTTTSPAPTLCKADCGAGGTTESGTLCRTDSGFNEMEESKNRRGNTDITEQAVSNLQYNNGETVVGAGDISMMMTDD